MEQTKKELKKKGNPSKERQRKFLLMIPILIFPFLTGAFWALGGGSGNKTVQQAEVHKGVNTTLPARHFNKKETVLDKLGFYQKAALDSAKLAEKQKTDPYLAIKPISAPEKGMPVSTGAISRGNENTLYSAGQRSGIYADANEEKVTKRLEQLRKVISQPSQQALPTDVEGFPSAISAPSLHASPEIDRLEKLMQALKQSGDSASHDPSLDRLNGMLDKVLKIQHPELVSTAQEKPVLPQLPLVAPAVYKPTEGSITTLEPSQPAATDRGKEISPELEDGFLAIDDNSGTIEETGNTFRAVISEDQTLVSGATIKLRLTEDARVNGVFLPKDNFIYGTVTLNNERLLISIKSIVCDNSIYPVNLQVFDLDGMAGIFIPGAISRDVSKESAAEGVNSMGITTLDASLGAQAANAGIQAAKSLFSKKIKLVRVSVKSGYEVLLKESKTNS